MHKSEIVKQLQDLGLTSYEARCYVSLAALGPSETKKVAHDAGIPHPSGYTALENLASKGWVDQVIRKPATYRAKNPAGIEAALEAKLEDAFEELKKIYRTEPAEEAELVYTQRGSEKVLAKVYEMLRGAKESVVLVTPSTGLGDSRLLELLREAVGRGLRVRVLGDEGAVNFLPPGVEIRIGNLVAVDLLVDDKLALIALPDYSACGWIESPAVATHFKQFLELLWGNSKPVHRRRQNLTA